MVDYSSVGFSLAVTSLALMGGFLGSGTFFFLDQYLRQKDNGISRYLSLAISVGFFIIFFAIIYFFSASGNLYSEYSKTLPENNQILVNLSCIGYNCTANIPNNLQISCPVQNCPPQNICPIQTPIPIPTPRIEVYRCPWSLSLP